MRRVPGGPGVGAADADRAADAGRRPGRAPPLTVATRRGDRRPAGAPAADRRAGRDERIETTRRWLERYLPIVDDAAAWHRALEQPAPLDLLVPGRRRTRDEVARTLAARGLDVERLDASPYHLRVRTDAGAGTLPEVVFGFAYPQGVSSALAPLALAPRPGERVLDLCAAPGGKTVLLDALAGGEAEIVANDRSRGRTGILVQSLARQAVDAALVVCHDGGAFPSPAAGMAWDAILLDAPCTGEGTFRVPSPRYDPRGERGLAEAHGLQVRLLTRACDLLAPGGRIVYATCSLAPEENEAVIAEVLAGRDDMTVADLPSRTPGLAGLTRWNGAHWPDAMQRARRVFPHHTGSWGFFVALLRKREDAVRVARPRREDAPRVVLRDDDELRRATVAHFAERFGVPAGAFDRSIVTARGRSGWLLHAFDRAAGRDVSRLDVVAPGLRAVHVTRRGLRASSAGLRALDRAITASRIDLDWNEGLALLERGALERGGEGPGGHVAVAVDGTVIGGGLLRDGRLELEIPAAWRQASRPE
ncbi:MAG: RsmB/NOP family class I SAM-dependent RNA methyltransferase [Acidobacteria bacterium]|nr:MAG: RsmB/NOP family class I SAM-dependent RNA methyltransferase [Acidobacteriota bacterium]